MPKCLECGIVLSRLQWTHFRYKCTGRFRDSKEYILEYPNAELVDSSVAEKTTLTKENFIKKYGKEEGNNRWDIYCTKQSYSNSLEYKSKKYGWDEDQFKEFNKSRAVTLNNLIEKHGYEKGNEMWDNYIERQRYTTSLSYFIEKYGSTHGTLKYNKYMSTILYNFSLQGRGISKLEIEIGDHLQEYHDVVPQYKIDGINGKFDFYVNGSNLIIEVYGTFWHRDPRKYDLTYSMLDKKTIDIRKFDITKRLSAIHKSYKVYVIWELDWKRDKEETMKNILRWINDNKKR